MTSDQIMQEHIQKTSYAEPVHYSAVQCATKIPRPDNSKRVASSKIISFRSALVGHWLQTMQSSPPLHMPINFKNFNFLISHDSLGAPNLWKTTSRRNILVQTSNSTLNDFL